MFVLIAVDLAYECFNMRQGTPQAISLEDSAPMYRGFEGRPMYGKYTHILCTSFDLLRGIQLLGGAKILVPKSASHHENGRVSMLGARTASCLGRRQP